LGVIWITDRFAPPVPVNRVLKTLFN
jgi:hypothetical protein